MSLVLPRPAGKLRAKLSQALDDVPEVKRDALIVEIVQAMEDIGLDLVGKGWLEDDDPLLNAIRERGLDGEGMIDGSDQGGDELFLDMNEDDGLPYDKDISQM